jgi:2,4-dienoyl-CoA reductase (NADPH2)
VIVASGGVPTIPDIQGLRDAAIPVVHAHDILAGKTGALGNDIVIVGGGPTACETALYLREQGSLDAETVKFLLVHRLVEVEELRRLATIGRPDRRVSLVQRSGRLAKDLNKSVRWTLLHAMEEASVATHVNAEIASVKANAVVIKSANGELQEIPCDCIVVAAGIAPDNALYATLKKELPDVPAHLVGDAVAARQATEALLEGFATANTIT